MDETNVCVCGDLIFLGVEWMYQQIWIIVGNIIKLMINPGCLFLLTRTHWG